MKKAVIILGLISLFFTGYSQTVTNTNDSGPGSLRAEIAAATSGATITIDPSLANSTLTLTSGQLTIGSNLIIVGADGFAISGNNASIVLDIAAGVNFTASNLIIQNGFSAGFGGGGLNSFGNDISFTDCVFSGNVSNFGGGGALIFPTGSTIFNRCTFTGNSCPVANGGGGAIQHFTGGLVPVFTNCTFSGNSAPLGFGGAIASGAIDVINCTFTGNSAGVQGGAVTFADPVAFMTASNCIFDGNSAPTGPEISGQVISDGSNLIFSTSGISFISGSGDIVGVSANLGPLANNGGLTPTHALNPGSPAIDAGNAATAPLDDQRGFARAGAGTGPDIGAYEFGAPVGPVAVPTLSQWGLILLALTIACIGAIAVWKKARENALQSA